MLDYPTLKVIWWLLIGVLLVGFAIMDGHDMGVGTLLPFVAKTDPERRVVINTVGPHWEGNQVWFISPFCGRCSSARSASTIAARSTIRPGVARGTGRCSWGARCRR